MKKILIEFCKLVIITIQSLFASNDVISKQCKVKSKVHHDSWLTCYHFVYVL